MQFPVPFYGGIQLIIFVHTDGLFGSYIVFKHERPHVPSVRIEYPDLHVHETFFAFVSKGTSQLGNFLHTEESPLYLIYPHVDMFFGVKFSTALTHNIFLINAYNSFISHIIYIRIM